MKPMEKLETLNLHSLLTNPTGKYSAFMGNRGRIIQDLDNRYYAVLATTKKNSFEFKVYKDKKNYIFYFKIPSEKYPKQLYYDVVIQFIPSSKEIEKSTTINDYDIHLFSNSPAFMFTYTYVLETNDMLIKFLKDKYSEQSLTEPPTIKNPVEVYGFEKSCYYACKFIKVNKLTNKFELNANLSNFSESSIKNKIVSQQAKFNQYKAISKQEKSNKAKNSLNVKTEAKATSNKTPRVKKVKQQARKPKAPKRAKRKI